MANMTILGGRTTKAAEIKKQGESIVAKFSLAVNDRRGKKAEKDAEASVTYVDCVAFGKQAEFAEKHLNDKGVGIVVTGHMRSDSYKNAEGKTVYTTNVVVDSYEFASCDLNKVLLIGRPIADPEIRYTTGSEPLCIARLNLAVDRRISKERKEAGDQSADFINIKAFGKTAEFVEKWVKKGVKIVVDGSYSKDIYEGKDKKKHAYIEVIAPVISFAETKADAERRASGSESLADKPAQAKAPADEDGFVDATDTPFEAASEVAEPTPAKAEEKPFAPVGSDTCPFDFGEMFA